MISKKILIWLGHSLVEGTIEGEIPIPSGKRPYNYLIRVDGDSHIRTVHKKYVYSLEIYNEYKEKLKTLINGS